MLFKDVYCTDLFQLHHTYIVTTRAAVVKIRQKCKVPKPISCSLCLYELFHNLVHYTILNPELSSWSITVKEVKFISDLLPNLKSSFWIKVPYSTSPTFVNNSFKISMLKIKAFFNPLSSMINPINTRVDICVWKPQSLTITEKRLPSFMVPFEHSIILRAVWYRGWSNMINVCC